MLVSEALRNRSLGFDMKKKASLVVTLLAVILLAGVAVAGETGINGKCVKVIDGDTLVVKCDESRRTVEIDGIDAPELDQPWGKEVRSFVKSMVQGRQVEIEVIEGGDDTVRARVFIDGVDLAEMLASRGLAWVPEDGADGELLSVSKSARDLPCGLWMDADPVPPWEFRESRS